MTEEDGYAFAISRARAPVHPGSDSDRIMSVCEQHFVWCERTKGEVIGGVKRVASVQYKVSVNTPLLIDRILFRF